MGRMAGARTGDLRLEARNVSSGSDKQRRAFISGSSRTAPIIMVTTEAERNRVVEAIKAGVNAYVVKPFTPEILQQRINEAQEKAA